MDNFIRVTSRYALPFALCVFKANFLCFYGYFIYYILYIIFLHSATFTPNECLLAIYAKFTFIAQPL